MDKKENKASTAIELNKRGAAGMAKTTQGRSRVIPDKTKYDRKVQNDQITKTSNEE